MKISYKNKLLANVKVCNNLLSRSLGLMFSRSLTSKEGCLLQFDKEQNVGLHNFFVFYPIDVLWLNKHKKIINMKSNFKPFTWTKAYKAKWVLELKAGKIKELNLKNGHLLSFNSA